MKVVSSHDSNRRFSEQGLVSRDEADHGCSVGRYGGVLSFF
jgi:hypothetical protein